jgi:hypothetical protein
VAVEQPPGQLAGQPHPLVVVHRPRLPGNRSSDRGADRPFG